MIQFPSLLGIGKKPGPPSRKDFVRTKISLGENIASGIILVLLVGIGVGIAIEGRNFDPNLYMVRSGSLDATAAPVVGKSQTIRAATDTVPATSPDKAVPAEKPTVASGPAENPENDGSGEDSGAAPPPAATGQPMDITLAGITPMSATEFYSSDTLYEKIDGRAPAYQNFNVQQLRCRTFSVLAAQGSYVDVYEYRFDTPLDAFGMFASERDPKGKPLDFAADGYSGELGYFFRRGPVYVQIIASDEKPETQAVSTALAQNRATTLPADDTGLASRQELPVTGMIPNSIGFIPADAQGQNSLKNVFQAKYNFNGTEFPFFIMNAASPDEAAKAWASFQKFCGSFGKTEPLPNLNGGKLFRAQIFGKWKIVYLRNNELGGVFDATDPDKARAFVEQYLQGKLK